jgi:hypothetical protein
MRKAHGAGLSAVPSSLPSGLSTKIHVLVDALGNPVELMLSPGQLQLLR